MGLICELFDFESSKRLFPLHFVRGLFTVARCSASLVCCTGAVKSRWWSVTLFLTDTVWAQEHHAKRSAQKHFITHSSTQLRVSSAFYLIANIYMRLFEWEEWKKELFFIVFSTDVNIIRDFRTLRLSLIATKQFINITVFHNPGRFISDELMFRTGHVALRF